MEKENYFSLSDKEYNELKGKKVHEDYSNEEVATKIKKSIKDDTVKQYPNNADSLQEKIKKTVETDRNKSK